MVERVRHCLETAPKPIDALLLIGHDHDQELLGYLHSPGFRWARDGVDFGMPFCQHHHSKSRGVNRKRAQRPMRLMHIWAPPTSPANGRSMLEVKDVRRRRCAAGPARAPNGLIGHLARAAASSMFWRAAPNRKAGP